MNFTDFVQFVKTRCMYETIYEDSDSNLILVIRMLDAFAMANKFEEVGRWPSAAIGKETLQDALARENGTQPQPEQEPVDITNHVSDEDEETCPNCGKPLQSNRGGGVVCSARCGYWFCF